MTKYKLQEMPDVHNTGKKRVYPKLVTNRQLGTKEFIERMRAHNHAISESVVRHVKVQWTFADVCSCTNNFEHLLIASLPDEIWPRCSFEF